MEYVNNVNYNNFSQGFFTQTGLPFMRNGEPMKWDILGNYTMNGPNGGAPPVYVLAVGDSPPGSWTGAWNFKWEGGTWRNVDGTPHPNNDEANNYTMFGTYMHNGYPPEPIVVRSERITQPPFAVRVQSTHEAYESVVGDEDVGALPHDAHAQRLVDAPENGDAYDQALIPSPFGSGTVRFEGTAPTDRDSDGLPDAYELRIGTDPDTFENHTALDQDGDGYVNIEDYAHSLSPHPQYRTCGD